jgi:hypothetical protein
MIMNFHFLKLMIMKPQDMTGNCANGDFVLNERFGLFFKVLLLTINKKAILLIQDRYGSRSRIRD